MAQRPSDIDVCELTRQHLDRLGRRPTVAEIAAACGITPVQLRRALQQTGGATFRATLTDTCLAHAASLIRSGTKVEAAMRLAGFRNKTNFNKQFVRRFGMLPSMYRKARYSPPRLVEFDLRFVLRHLFTNHAS